MGNELCLGTEWEIVIMVCVLVFLAFVKFRFSILYIAAG